MHPLKQCIWFRHRKNGNHPIFEGLCIYFDRTTCSQPLLEYFFQQYGARMTKFSTISYFIYQRFKCYTNLLSRNCFTIKNQIFYFYFKKFCNFHNLTVTNISNNIIKQYYGIIKLFKVLAIVKKKHFSRTNILI